MGGQGKDKNRMDAVQGADSVPEHAGEMAVFLVLSVASHYLGSACYPLLVTSKRKGLGLGWTCHRFCLTPLIGIVAFSVQVDRQLNLLKHNKNGKIEDFLEVTQFMAHWVWEGGNDSNRQPYKEKLNYTVWRRPFSSPSAIFNLHEWDDRKELLDSNRGCGWNEISHLRFN